MHLPVSGEELVRVHELIAEQEEPEKKKKEKRKRRKKKKRKKSAAWGKAGARITRAVRSTHGRA